MNLQDFIKETLVEIMQGVRDAQQEIGANTSGEPATVTGTIVGSNVLQQVDFDVAVTTTSESGGGAKVSVLGIGAGMDGKSSTEAVSRIKFSVPIKLPRGRQ